MSEQPPPHPAQPCLSVPTGYYQNEKVFEEEPEDRETDSMLGSSHRVMPAVANPEYFEQDGDEVWETKAVLNGLPHNGPAAFRPQDVAQAQAAARDNGHNYYNDFSHPPPPLGAAAGAGAGAGAGRGGRVLVRDHLPSESQV